jgi:spore coat protein F
LNDYQRPAQQHLAWHESLEMHELVAFQANHLMTSKMQLPKVQDPTLRELYMECIDGLQQNLRELIPYYQQASATGTRKGEDESQRPTSVEKQLLNAIQLHGKVFYFMYQRGYYPAYQFDKILANDLKMAHTAMSM